MWIAITSKTLTLEMNSNFNKISPLPKKSSKKSKKVSDMKERWWAQAKQATSNKSVGGRLSRMSRGELLSPLQQPPTHIALSCSSSATGENWKVFLHIAECICPYFRLYFVFIELLSLRFMKSCSSPCNRWKQKKSPRNTKQITEGKNRKSCSSSCNRWKQENYFSTLKNVFVPILDCILS